MPFTLKEEDEKKKQESKDPKNLKVTDTAGKSIQLAQAGAGLAKSIQSNEGGETSDVLGSTVQGASAGAAFPPYGAAIGGGIGLAVGVVQATAARKAKKAKAEASHQKRLAQIEQNKADQLRKAYSGMAQNIGSTLRSV